MRRLFKIACWILALFVYCKICAHLLSLPVEPGQLETIQLSGKSPVFEGSNSVSMIVPLNDGRQLRAQSLQAYEAGKIQHFLNNGRFENQTIAGVKRNTLYLGYLWGGPRDDYKIYSLKTGNTSLISFPENMQFDRIFARIFFGLSVIAFFWFVILKITRKKWSRHVGEEKVGEAIPGFYFFAIKNTSPKFGLFLTALVAAFTLVAYSFESRLEADARTCPGVVQQVYPAYSNDPEGMRLVSFSVTVRDSEESVIEMPVDSQEIKKRLAPGDEVSLLYNPSFPGRQLRFPGTVEIKPITISLLILFVICFFVSVFLIAARKMKGYPVWQ